MTLQTEALDLLRQMGVSLKPGQMPTRTPITGESLGAIAEHTPAEAGAAIAAAHRAYRDWRNTPAPQRGRCV